MGRLTIFALFVVSLSLAYLGRQVSLAADQVAPPAAARAPATVDKAASETVDDQPVGTVQRQTPERDPLDQSLERQLGEDVGMAPSQRSLETVAEDMRRASQRILNRDAPQQTRQLQQQVVRDLDDLIDTLNKRRSNDSDGSKNSTSKQAASTKQSAGTPSGTSGRQAAADSKLGSAKGTGGNVEKMGVQQVNQFLDQVWGQLPEHVRQQVSQKWGEEFLPKYQSQIEEYYRRLAEDGKPSGP